MTNNEFFERIYKPYQEQHMSKSTCYTRCNIIGNRLLDEHGEEEPGDISYLVIEGIYDDMETAGLMQNTIFGTYAALLSFFKMAVEYGEVEDNPVRLLGHFVTLYRRGFLAVHSTFQPIPIQNIEFRFSAFARY